MNRLPDNLISLHSEEERIRAQSSQATAAEDALCDHLHAIHDAMDHLTGLLYEPSEEGSSIHTLQLVAIRVFNTTASALRLGLSGYYQASFHLTRDLLEIVNLLDLFRVYPSALEEWRAADNKTLKKRFAPAKVRVELAAHPEFAGQQRQRPYESMSSLAAHMSYAGFRLIAPNNKPRPGPFFDVSYLKAFLEELAAQASHASLALGLLFEDVGMQTLVAKQHFLDRLRSYHAKHLEKRRPAASGK